MRICVPLFRPHSDKIWPDPLSSCPLHCHLHYGATYVHYVASYITLPPTLHCHLHYISTHITLPPTLHCAPLPCVIDYIVLLCVVYYIATLKLLLNLIEGHLTRIRFCVPGCCIASQQRNMLFTLPPSKITIYCIAPQFKQ